MNEELKKRIKAYFWGMGGFTVVAVAVYVMNVSDVREIEPWKLLTIVVTVACGYIVNQGTRYLNKQDLTNGQK